jgi:hypothetical protein
LTDRDALHARSATISFAGIFRKVLMNSNRFTFAAARLP